MWSHFGSLLHIITGYAYMRRSYKEHSKSGEDDASDIEQMEDLGLRVPLRQYSLRVQNRPINQ